MYLEGLVRVGRAGRVEPTRRWATGEGALVELDERQRATLSPGHLGRTDRAAALSISCRRHCSSSANVCSLARGVAPTSIRPGGTSQSRRRARRRRRSRLRCTADPVARPMANATWGGKTSGSGTNEHQSGSILVRTPSRRRRMNASRSRIRSIKPTDGCGPWRDGTSARHGRRVCSSAHGSRACALGGGCWAGRYASRRSPDTSRCNNHEPGRNDAVRLLHGLTYQGYGPAGICANHQSKPHRCKLSTDVTDSHHPSVWPLSSVIGSDTTPSFPRPNDVIGSSARQVSAHVHIVWTTVWTVVGGIGR